MVVLRDLSGSFAVTLSVKVYSSSLMSDHSGCLHVFGGRDSNV